MIAPWGTSIIVNFVTSLIAYSGNSMIADFNKVIEPGQKVLTLTEDQHVECGISSVMEMHDIQAPPRTVTVKTVDHLVDPGDLAEIGKALYGNNEVARTRSRRRSSSR